MSWRELNRFAPAAKSTVMTERPGIDSERNVATPCAPLIAFSSGWVTSCSTCSAVNPAESVWIVTCDGTNSGKTSNELCHAPHADRTSASTLNVTAAPRLRTQREINHSIARQSCPGVATPSSRDSNRPVPLITTG